MKEVEYSKKPKEDNFSNFSNRENWDHWCADCKFNFRYINPKDKSSSAWREACPKCFEAYYQKHF